MARHLAGWVFAIASISAGGAIAAGLGATLAATAPRFYPDDPISVEPDTQDASGVQRWEVDLTWDLVENLFTVPGDRALDVRAQNVNTVDEVPNGAWFVNRAGAMPLTADDVGRGAGSGRGPAAGRWTVVSAKSDGITPGFTIRDRAGDIWFIKFDPPGARGMATGAEIVAARLFWALGYHTPEYHIARLRIDELDIAEGTRITPPGAKSRQMKIDDLEWLVRDADRSRDGSYRVSASKALPGKPIGGFRFYGTRPDDPNDVVPHEHRRELRGYAVFAAWLNHVDAKSINTLDALLTEGGRGYIRHHLLDFGSTLGSAAIAPREPWEGHEYLIETDTLHKSMLGLGFYGLGKRMTPAVEAPAVGRIARDDSAWDPEAWKPRIPNPAFLRARADDKFWAARRVAAVSNEMIDAAIAAAALGDPYAEQQLARMIRQRRDAIARRYLTAINPVCDPALDAHGRLTFRNAAVDAGVAAAAAQYRVLWSSFDNATGETREIGESSGSAEGIDGPETLPSQPDAYVRAAIRAADHTNPAWTRPVHAFFHRTAIGWRLVGFDRLPERS